MRNALLTLLASACLISCSAAQAEPNRVEQLEELAENGNAKAQYHLGMMFLTGTEVDRDQQRAVEYFETANELGDPLAAYKLGCFYDGQYQLFDLDFEKALALKLVAAKAGYALAQQDVAGLYARELNYSEALVWLERAAAQGASDAIEMYSSVHNGAEGIKADPVITAAYFRILLNRSGSSEAQKNWLEDFEAKLTDVQRNAALRMASSYRPQPTQLTLEALSGLSATDVLIRSN